MAIPKRELKKMIDQIRQMTPEEYNELFEESQKVCNVGNPFAPEKGSKVNVCTIKSPFDMNHYCIRINVVAEDGTSSSHNYFDMVLSRSLYSFEEINELALKIKDTLQNVNCVEFYPNEV